MTRTVRLLSAAIPIFLLFASCQKIFTTSLGEMFARDPADLIPKVTSSNAAELAEKAKGDPDSSMEVLNGLVGVIASAPAEKKADLVALALGVSSSASGIENTILKEGDSLMNILKNDDLTNPAVKDQVYGIVSDALGGLSNLDESSTTLVKVLSAPGAPTIDQIAASSSAEDLAKAAVLLLSANAAKASGGASGYIENFSPSSTTLTPSESLAVDLAQAAATKYKAEGGTGPLADLLGTLNLTP